MAAKEITTQVLGELDPSIRRQVEQLLSSALEHDGVNPLNEAATFDMRSGQVRDGVAHLLAYRDEDLVGYAHLDSVTGLPCAQLVVHPDARRQAVATIMLSALGFDPHNPEHAARMERGMVLTMWAFGDLPAARGWAEKMGFRASRELLVMQREAGEPLPEAPVPEGITLRTFEPGDAEDWLRVNSRAFASHPEQGAMTAEDLEERFAEPWYDPTGFFVATKRVDDREQMIGFHWTKRHSETLGEVYVIAVDPDHGAGGLGRALLYAGLRYLYEKGAERVILYVEGDLSYVVDFYTSAKFVVSNRDVLYASTADASRP